MSKHSANIFSFTRNFKFRCRSRIESVDGRKRLDVKETSITKDSTDLGYEINLVCQCLECATPGICILGQTTSSARDQRILSLLEEPIGIILSPVFTHSQVPSEDTQGEGNDNNGLSAVAGTSVVSAPLELSVDVPSVIKLQVDLLTSSLQQPHPLYESLILTALKLSGDDFELRIFRKTLSTFCLTPTVQLRTLLTSWPGTVGSIGALNGILIPCLMI